MIASLLLNRYVIGGLIIALLIGGGYFYVKYQNHRIEKLQAQVQALEVRLEVTEKAQEATKKFIQGRSKVEQKYGKEEAYIDSAVSGGNNSAIRGEFTKHGMLNPKGGVTPNR